MKLRCSMSIPKYFESIINRRVDIPEDIRRFQKTLQYARSKVDYVISEFIYMLPSDMNLWIGKVKNYSDKILISSPSFKINLDGKKNEPDVKPKGEEIVKTKPNIEPNKEHKQDVKPNIKFDKESKPDMNKITYVEEKVTLVLGITSIFTVWWLFK